MIKLPPKKLIREGMINVIAPEERERITDPDELNRLYALKIHEELGEIQRSSHKDIGEFADLLQVVLDFAGANGFTEGQLEDRRVRKERDVNKGYYENLVLTNLNPNNLSNSVYFPVPNEKLLLAGKLALAVEALILNFDIFKLHGHIENVTTALDNYNNAIFSDFDEKEN